MSAETIRGVDNHTRGSPPEGDAAEEPRAEYVTNTGGALPCVGPRMGVEGELARRRRKRHKILVVDDEVTVCMSVRKVLSKGGWREVDAASGAEEAIRKIETNDYSIILLDLKLGPDDGLTLLENIKRVRPHQPVIVITGYASLESAVKATKLGAEDYITKPFTSRELKQAVDDLLAP